VAGLAPPWGQTLSHNAFPAYAFCLFVSANRVLKAGLGVNDMSMLIEIAAALNNGTVSPLVESNPK
jgi:hypothetical protein